MTSLADMPGGGKAILEHTKMLEWLFTQADAEGLQRALQAEDVPGVCLALHISEEVFRALLRDGQGRAQELAIRYPELMKQARPPAR